MPSQRWEPPPAAAELTGPGGPYEVVEREIDGANLRLFKQAPQNLGELYHAALEHGDKDFFVYDDERYTFADAWRQAEQVSASLRALDIKPGDRVGIAMRNYPEWVWAFMGITRLGAVAVLAVVSPTGDAVTLLLISAPVIILYEGGLLLGRFVTREKKE